MKNNKRGTMEVQIITKNKITTQNYKPYKYRKTLDFQGFLYCMFRDFLVKKVCLFPDTEICKNIPQQLIICNLSSNSPKLKQSLLNIKRHQISR